MVARAAVTEQKELLLLVLVRQFVLVVVFNILKMMTVMMPLPEHKEIYKVVVVPKVVVDPKVVVVNPKVVRVILKIMKVETNMTVMMVMVIIVMNMIMAMTLNLIMKNLRKNPSIQVCSTYFINMFSIQSNTC